MIEATGAHAAWRAAFAQGTLHGFQMRLECPCCPTIWYQEVVDAPATFEIPDRLRMGLAMLCGSCEARRLTMFVVPGKGGWSAPFLTQGEISQAFARLHKEKRPWITAEGMGPWSGEPLRDDRRDVFRACTTRIRDGRRYNVTAMTAEVLASSGLKWKAPPAPVGRDQGDSW
jgi:hypothetical protein